MELRALGRDGEAVAAHDRALALDPVFVPAWRGKAALARHRGDRPEALRLLRAVAALRPKDLALQLDHAAELREQGLHAEGEDLARRLARDHPRSAQALLALVPHTPLASDVADLLARAVGVDPDDGGVRLAAAKGFAEIWRLDEAATHYDAILARDPRASDALVGRALIATRQGCRGKAHDLLRQACALPGLPAGAERALAQHLAEDGDPDDAERRLLALLARLPDDLATMLQLGQVRRLGGDEAGARRAFSEAVARHPGHPAALLGQIKNDVALGFFSDGLDRLATLFAQHPDHPGALQALGDCAQQSDDFRTASLVFAATARRSPADPQPRLSLAGCLAKLGRTAEALSHLDTLMDEGRALGPVLVTWVDLARVVGFLAEARARAAEARVRLPGYPPLRIAAIQADLAAGRLEEAARALEEPCEGGRMDTASLHHLRGLLALQRGDLRGVVTHLDRSIAAGSRDAGLHQTLAHALLLEANPDAAEPHLRRSRDLSARQMALKGINESIMQTHSAWLLDEARRQPALLAALGPGSGEGEEARLAALVSAVREKPEATSSGVLLVTHLRRFGAAARLDELRHAHRPDRIPKRLVQFWDSDDPPADILALSGSWRDHNPELRCGLTSEREARTLLKSAFPDRVLAAFDRSQEPAMKADIFRLAALVLHGGYYADADDRCIAPIAQLNPGGCSLLVYQEMATGAIGNNFLGAAPGHPVLREALRQAVEASERGSMDIVWFSTGPGLLTRACASSAARSPAALHAFLADTLILDQNELSRSVASHCQTAHKSTARHWSRTTFGSGEPAILERVRTLAATLSFDCEPGKGV